MTKLPRYYVIDLETSIKNKGEDAVGTMKASPFYPDNRIVLGGVRFHDDPQSYFFLGIEPPPAGSDLLLVGQNIKFDLLYLYRNPTWRQWAKEGKIWDTMIVEYLLTGQMQRYIDLDTLSEKYGGTLKDDKIGEYWDNDIDTEDIPEEELREYLDGDLRNTEIVLKGQYAKAKELGMLPLIESQMEALMATTEMEWNGMYFDVAKAVDHADKVEDELNKTFDLVIREMESIGIVDPKPGSHDHVSLCLFGGEQKVTEYWKMIGGEPIPPDEEKNFNPWDFDVFGKTAKKAGQQKLRRMDITKKIDGYLDPMVWSKPAKKAGFFSTAEDVLKNISKNAGGTAALFVDELLKFRGLDKDLNTYYVGYGNLYWPHDQCIHGSFNHCATATGRLSSSKPNLQNLSNKK